jgi:hypothetical protein
MVEGSRLRLMLSNYTARKGRNDQSPPVDPPQPP